MPLFRLLIITLIIGAGYYLYRRLTLKPPPKPPQTDSTTDSTHAVKCALCGLHVPDNEAIRRNSQTYCCQEHADRLQP